MILATLVFGIRIEILLIVLFLLVIILGVLLFLVYSQLQQVSRKYYILTRGKKARDLEQIMLTRFDEKDEEIFP